VEAAPGCAVTHRRTWKWDSDCSSSVLDQRTMRTAVGSARRLALPDRRAETRRATSNFQEAISRKRGDTLREPILMDSEV